MGKKKGKSPAWHRISAASPASLGEAVAAAWDAAGDVVTAPSTVTAPPSSGVAAPTSTMVTAIPPPAASSQLSIAVAATLATGGETHSALGSLVRASADNDDSATTFDLAIAHGFRPVACSGSSAATATATDGCMMPKILVMKKNLEGMAVDVLVHAGKAVSSDVVDLVGDVKEKSKNTKQNTENFDIGTKLTKPLSSLFFGNRNFNLGVEL